MNNLIRHIISNPEIKNVVLLGGKNFDPWLVHELATDADLDSIRVYASGFIMVNKCKKIVQDMKKEITLRYSGNISIHEIDEINELDVLAPNCALVFDMLDDDRIVFALTRLKPYCLCGTVNVDSISSFDIWEEYRTVSNKIYLLTWRIGGKSEVLQWEKRKDNDIELSVILPMYNVEEYLPGCISTVTNWTADYLEFLFIDDGSPDNCAQLVEEASRKDKRIKLIRKKNGGCASARQRGLDEAKGTYVGFIDPDDYVEESMFRKLLSRAMIGSYDIAYCGYAEQYTEVKGMRQIPDTLGEPYISGTTEPAQILNLCAFCRVAIWRGIYSNRMIKTAKLHFYEDIKRFDDLPFKFQSFASAKSVVCVPEHLYYYRIGRPGQDVSANDERLFVHFDIFKHLDTFVRTKGTNEMVEMLQIVKLKTHEYALQKILPEYKKRYLELAHDDLKSLYSKSESRMVFKRFLSKRDRLIFEAIMKKSMRLLELLQ